MDIHEPRLGDYLRNVWAEQLAGTSAVKHVDAMDYRWVGLGEALSQQPSQKQVLGGASASPLAQHPLDAAVTRTAIRESADSFNQLEKRRARRAQSSSQHRRDEITHR